MVQVVLEITDEESIKKLSEDGEVELKGKVVVMAISDGITKDLERLEELENS